MHAGEAALARHGPAEYHLFNSNVPVGVLCSDVPTPGRLQSFHLGIGTAEGFLALDIIVAPLCYKRGHSAT